MKGVHKIYGSYGLNHQIIEKVEMPRTDERKKIGQYSGRPESIIFTKVILKSILLISKYKI